MKTFYLLLASITINLAHGADWPHWRGPDRDGKSPDSTGWDQGMRIPPRADWEFNAGHGASSPLVVKGVLYTLGWQNNQDTLHAIDAATGQTLWKQSYSSPKYGRHARGDQMFFRGATPTPEHDTETGIIYTLSCDGELQGWDTNQRGEKLWWKNLYEAYNIEVRPQVTKRRGSHRDYGYTTAPLIQGDLLLVEVGSTRHGNTIAFDKDTGKEIWRSENKDPAGHTGGLCPVTIDGEPCIAVLTAKNLVVLQLEDGRTVGAYPWTTDFINNIATPVASGNRILVTSRYNQNAMAMVEFSLKRKPKLVWKIKEASGVCSPVVHKGSIYWANKGLYCIDLNSGRMKWEGSKFGDAGSCIITSDDRLIIWSDSGSLTLAETSVRSPDKYTSLQRIDNIFRGMAWPHVVFVGGRIYCRDISGRIKCFSMQKGTPAAPRKAPGSAPAPTGEYDLSKWDPQNDSEPVPIYSWTRADKNQESLAKRGNATFDEDGRMIVDDGSFQVEGITHSLLEAARKSGELTVETLFKSHQPRQTGPARIITFSRDGYQRNFTLAQEKNELRFRLRTPKTGKNGTSPETVLGRIEADQLYHLLVTYRNGQLLAYLNGNAITDTNLVEGDFSNWDAEQELVFGAEFTDGRNWNGSFDGIALYSRFFDAKTARNRYLSLIKMDPAARRRAWRESRSKE